MITNITVLPNNKVELTVECNYCGSKHTLKVNCKDYKKYISGEYYIQDCFPYLSPEDRELLISSMCLKCWNKLFHDMD